MMENNKVHVFALCAYKESPYLEECIRSLLGQSVLSKVILCTSTPGPFLTEMAEKYHLPLFVRDGKSDIQDDWNFAYNTAEGDLVTVAHQDDVYHQDYVKVLLSLYRKYPDMTMFLTDYLPIKGGEIGKRDKNSLIKRFLRLPLKIRRAAHIKWLKRMVLSLGNTVCCPTCTYHKKLLGENVFTSDLKFSLDWDTFLKLANRDGRFAYADIPLVFYRIHDQATSKEFITDNRRVGEDIAMFKKFWPMPVVKLIMVFYKKAYDTYS